MQTIVKDGKREIKVFKWLENLNARLATIYVLNIIDLIVTTIWVMMFGLEIEVNPIARWMYETNIIYVFKTVIVAAGLYLLNQFLPRNPKYMWTSWVLLIVYGALACYHCFIIVKVLIIFSTI